MVSSVNSSFERKHAESPNQVGLSVLFLMGWVATCDGTVSSEEELLIRNIATNSGHAEEIDSLLLSSKSLQRKDYALALSTLKGIDRDYSAHILELMLAIALSDGYLVATEIYVLRFLEDFFGLQGSENGLAVLFQSRTGRPLPSSGDVSDPAWWRAREAKKKTNPRNQQQHSRSRQTGGRSRATSSPSSSSYDLRRLRDLAMLGLEDSASHEEIRTAYRRLAKVHHPDRFHGDGDEAIAAARETFARIQQAYERALA